MRTNYVLIDYENVQPEMLSILHSEHFKIIVFVGASQSKVSYEVAATLQKMGEQAQYIKITKSGPNALDFHIAYYIGAIAAKDPQAYFHIISKDKGFDPLLAHLRTQKILSSRYNSVDDIPLARTLNAGTREERLIVVVNSMKKRGTSRPRLVKTLTSTIHSIFQKQISLQEVAAMIEEMKNKKIIKIQDEKITYHLPA